MSASRLHFVNENILQLILKEQFLNTLWTTASTSSIGILECFESKALTNYMELSTTREATR
jgi:hypothetical protein